MSILEIKNVKLFLREKVSNVKWMISGNIIVPKLQIR